MAVVKALVCDVHRGGECVVCGKSPANHPALLCDDCGFGSNRENCCVCNKWPARYPAKVCDEHKGMCVKCGRDIYY